MLNHLNIRDFAIVPTLDLDIQQGFTAITGETGAGKSILVDALGLLLGDRSDASWVRPGAERAELTAGFSLKNNREAQKWLDEFELSADENCLLRRTINANGRSRAFVNGSPVTVAQIQSLGQLLVEIHGQNEHLRLTRTAEQFRLLDGSGDYDKEITSVINSHAEWQKLAKELQALDRETSIPVSELDFLKFQLDELQQHDLSAESIRDLQTEHDRLAAGGALLEALTSSIEVMEPEVAMHRNGVNSDLNGVIEGIQKFAGLDPDIGNAIQMLQEAAVNCVEAISALRAARERIDLDATRLERVEKRLDQLHDLARKHRVRLEVLENTRDQLTTRIEHAGNSEQHRNTLLKKLQTHLLAYRKAAQRLHLRRKDHASELSQRVIGLMGELGMGGGTFELSVSLNEVAAPSPRGNDEIRIMISANPGLPPGPLNKIASGGELSRISLAIKVATTGSYEAVTQIFDEIDAGIGGDTANAVGRLMKRLSGQRFSGHGQALCVTHLAQVAVCATHHLLVQKATENDSTVVNTIVLDRDTRVNEIARMLSGKISEQSRAHARELLYAADKND